MKKWSICRTLTLAALAVCALGQITMAAFSSGTDNPFYQELAQMTGSQDDSHYFGAAKVSLGSDILAIDGEALGMDAAAQLKNCRTMLPLQAMAVVAGAEADCDLQTGAVTLTTPYGTTLHYTIGGNVLRVNGESRTLDVSVYVEDGQVYLPLRATVESLAMEVVWDQETATATVTAPYQTARIIALTDELDAGALNAQRTISDGSGMWVLQFASPAQAKEALEALTEQGITVEPDLYIIK